jgi:hypothetical protein
MTSGKIPYNCDFATFANVIVRIAATDFDVSVEKAIRDAWVKGSILSQL